ncbi:RIP metalloprotease RseP [Limibacillus sp. MBR-115]|jgi:regulator of sigma E protease|uniref:RIP metalloprotease RseP n=1 Tax=Limibacillus sp. MBR-115 TaxID=3156465 RepID=UPI00339B789A
MLSVLNGFWEIVVPFLVILSILVFVHEMGHYLVARWNSVRVEVFSIGFGREIFGWNDKSGTRWKISLLPLGGYVKMFGDSDPASRPGEGVQEMTPEEKAVSFHHKRLGQRTAVVAAGPIANFIFAIILLAGLFLAYGQPFTPPVVGQIQEGSAAQAAGFQPDDRIIKIDGETIERFEDIQRLVILNPGTELQVDVLRDGSVLSLPVTPQQVEIDDNLGNKRMVGRLGITRSGVEYRSLGPVSAIGVAFTETGNLVVGTLRAVGQIIVGDRSTEELGGPIRIAQMSGQAAELGISAALWFAAVLSINLGLINLFPIPMLDGGHLMFYAFEWVRGRPLGERAQEYGFRIGLALVLSLMVLVTWNDLASLKVFDYLINLIS